MHKAAGKVCTGFSKPYVALYNAAGGVVTYTKGRILARGVDISIEPEVGDDNNFYADNIAAEASPGVFTGGTATLTVDGLLPESERLVMGLPDPETLEVGDGTVEITPYGDNMSIPYVGIGCVVRYLSGGVTSYTPTVLTKARFSTNGLEAATQEENIEYQTQELEATLMRDDSRNHNWKLVGEDMASEGEAEEVVRTILGIAPLESIIISKPPTKTEYTAGEVFDPTGMEITASYKGGGSAIVTNYTFAPDGPLTVLNDSVTITYIEGANIRTVAQEITVSAGV